MDLIKKCHKSHRTKEIMKPNIITGIRITEFENLVVINKYCNKCPIKLVNTKHIPEINSIFANVNFCLFSKNLLNQLE